MRHAIASYVKSRLPGYLVRDIAQEIRLLMRRGRYAAQTRRAVAGLRECRVNLGCGATPTPGWVNLDVFRAPNVRFWDCRQGLPFADSSVVAIYTEHMFEHLDFELEAKPFLKECLRSLRPGGVLRIVVPDAGAYLRCYGGAWEPLASMRPLVADGSSWRDRWLDASYQTQMQLINAVFRQGYEHKYAYDEETLALLLRETGFARVERQEFGVSLDRQMAPDSNERRSESLYMEAVK